MRFARFEYQNKEMWGVVDNDHVKLIKGSPFYDWSVTDEVVPLHKLILLPPCSPTKIVCVGLNYKDHAREFGIRLPDEPIIFLKPPSSLIGSGQKIEYPPESKQVDYEAELAVVIKDSVKNVSEEEVHPKILGFTCANDVTARDLQKKDGQWTRAKSFDTFCPVGPYLVTELDPHNLNIKLIVNGEVRQNSSTGNMVFNVYQLVSYISNIMTLYPEDVILTGTPSGVGPLRAGDVVSVEIEGIGRLTNEVVASNQKNFIDKTLRSAKI